MDEMGQWPEGRSPDEPLDSITTEPPVFGESRHSALSHMGAHEQNGDFLRGLGARRLKIVLFGGGGVLFLLMVVSALR